jgi:hypothetical protein
MVQQNTQQEKESKLYSIDNLVQMLSQERKIKAAG